MGENELLLAFDVGTTVVKGAVYTPVGKCLFRSGCAYGKYSDNPGWVEQNPQDWMDCIGTIVEQIMRQSDIEKIVGVGICSQVNTHVFVNSNGCSLMPAIVWEDQRCAEIADELNGFIETEGLQDTPMLDASSLVARAEWVKRYRPDVWQKTHSIISPKDYCILQLTGELVTDVLSSIGLVDEQGDYLSGALALVDGLEQRLPPLGVVDQIAGEINTNFFGIKAHCPVVVGTMDCWASLFGSGSFVHGQGIQMAGTSETLGLVSEQAHPAKGIVTFPRYQGLYLHAGPTQAGGDAMRWFAEAHGKSVPEALNAVKANVSANDPLIFLPYLSGERAPLWNPKARGAFIGLTKNHRESCMARAVMEGVGYASRHLMEHLEQAAGFNCSFLRISGGASRSDLWCQMKADIMNRSLHRVDNIDTGVFGAALMAGIGVGLYRSLDEAVAQGVTINQCFEPRENSRDSYDALYLGYRESYQRLLPVFNRLSEVVSKRSC